jgi:hypothetical protein
MMIQNCPVEVLDNIFDYTAYLDPENAQAILCSLMLTCSHFRVIAKRHFIRIACLPNAEKVNAFAGYLKQVVESGDYGNLVLPIQHLAVGGKYRVPRGQPYLKRSAAEVEAERVLPWIITTASPSLLTLTIFGVDSHNEVVIVDKNKRYHKRGVSDMVKFPNLRELVALEQRLIRLDFDKNGNNTADISRYPNLHRLYMPGVDSLEGFPSLLPNLRDLRLEMLYSAHARLPSLDKTLRVHSLIIDAPRYHYLIIDGFSVTHQSTADYDRTIDKYRTLIREICDFGDSGVVIPVVVNTRYTTRRRILAAWANAVTGGVGCWTTAWGPTVFGTGYYEDY